MIKRSVGRVLGNRIEWTWVRSKGLWFWVATLVMGRGLLWKSEEWLDWLVGLSMNSQFGTAGEKIKWIVGGNLGHHSLNSIYLGIINVVLLESIKIELEMIYGASLSVPTGINLYTCSQFGLQFERLLPGRKGRNQEMGKRARNHLALFGRSSGITFVV